MDLAQSTNFMGLRDLSAVWVVRQANSPVSQALETPRQDVLADDVSVLFKESLLPHPPRFFLDYLNYRDAMFPKSEFLFPTSDGKQYFPAKFSKRIKKLLEEARVPTSPSHPAELSDEQYQGLLNLRFHLQRPMYQNALAVALCSYLGLRPSEVARLVATDLDFDNRLILLRQTKSQDDQKLPLLSFMIVPFKNYVNNIPKRAPLFINALGLQWDRRDVTKAVSQWGEDYGVDDLTARKLRSSLGAMLARIGIPPAMLAKILRHKDPATALRHYNEMDLEDIRNLLENLHSRNLSFDRQAIENYERLYELLEADE